jgi:uncharacterized SAM-binding protein YcdF (DUF218 family)
MDPIPVLERLSHPTTQALVLGAIGVLVVLVRRYRLGVGIAALGLAWLIACATPAFADLLERGLAERFPSRAPSAYPRADAIVVLGGDGLPTIPDNWNDDPGQVGPKRIGFGYFLFAAGRAPLMLVCVGERGAQLTRALLERHGVPDDALQLEARSQTTWENALYTTPMLRREGAQRILLVTSQVHMRRAVSVFHKQGFEVIPAPTLEPESADVTSASGWPQRTALHRSDRYLHEYIGLWVYRLLGRA